MHVRIEVGPGEYMVLHESQARAIIEKVLTLVEDLDVCTDEELRDEVVFIKDRMIHYGLTS